MRQPPAFRSLRLLFAMVLVGILAPGAPPLRAASTGQTALYTPQGTTAGTANGDYITATMASGGLGTFYRYFIEVPPGLGRLVVEVFDADIGRGGANEDTAGRDRDRGGNYDTSVSYTLLRPDGTTAATLNNCDDNTCTDGAGNVWTAILNSNTAANTAAGHWELRVTMAAGDDINAIGIRAHDGNSDGTGTELNVYYDSQNQFGVNPPANGSGTRTYSVYPYITSGCSAAKNDFDFDSNSGNTGSLTLTSRGGFVQSYASTALSTDNTWRRDTFSGWTSDTRSVDYGIWTAAMTINTYTVNGAVNGNYTNLYFTNFQAAANPPAANPTASSFRVYLPTDAGAAPLKPYLEQVAAFSGCGLSGPNPPNTGQTSCFTVTIRIVNPTAQAITFSTPSNIVTANIPGGGAVYGGGAQATAGTTIVSQPSVGGTGNITWNPGTVAAGASKLLSYRVNVTPTSNGQRIPLTATPASGNGTRAQYRDETGNTTQARALILFGPLCELAVTEDLITQAVVSSFRASAAEGGGVQVEWSTASEAGTAGFYLYRWNAGSRRWEPVNRELLAGLIHEPQGGVYRFVDGGASPREPQTYLLEEVEAGGRRRTLGPFPVKVDWSREGSAGRSKALDGVAGGADYGREAHPAPLRGAAGNSAKAASGVVLPPSRPGGSAGTHLSARASGLYYLSSADVATWLGLTQSTAETLIGQGQLALSRGGQPVAWAPDITAKQAQGLFFYGQAPDNLYEAAGTYHLERGAGLLMQAVAAGAPAGPPAADFPETLHAERDAFAATLISPDPETDYWFWEFLQGDDATFGHHTFPLDAPGLVAGQSGTLTVSLYGATDSGVTGEHQAVVALNGTLLGETRWQGIAARRATFAIPAGVLQAAGNQVEVTAHTGAGAPYSIYYVDGFDLSYSRTFRAVGDALTFRADAKVPRVTVTGFTNPAIRLLDVSAGDPLRPRWITGAAVEADGAGGFQMSFVPSGPGPFLAAAPAALAAVASPRPWNPPSLRSADNRGDYLVIAPPGFQAAAKRLAALRRAQGLEARVVDLEAIFDEFSFGVFNPHAIRDFLTLAWQSWSLPPRYVALAGAGTLDYRNLLGFGDNLVPPLMVRTANGLFPSDNLLGDVDGDGLSEMAVGRIPVLSAAELNAYTDKIAAFEAAAPSYWSSHALFLADATDQGADFAADSQAVASHLAGYAVERIDLTSMPLAAARGQMMAAFANGTAFINYLGHGALDRLSAGGLLTSADVPNLGNGTRLPVLTAMTCTINRFAVPGFPALGELLVKAPSGGAAAVWGPSGVSFHGDARLLAERFYSTTDQRLGDRLHRAVAEFRNLGGDPALPRIYDLLGDPALRLKAPPAPATAPSAPGE